MKNISLMLILLFTFGTITGQLNAQNVIQVFDGDTIQTAIDTAVAGDTIKVSSGLYTESLTIDKQIHLIAAAPDTEVVIQSGGNAITYNSGSGGSTLVGFTIVGTSGIGVVINSVEVTIANNIISNCGVEGIQASNGFIIGNTIENNFNGINGLDSTKTVIVKNLILNNTNNGIYNLSGMAVANIIARNGDGVGDDAGISMAEGGIAAGNVIDSTDGHGIRITGEKVKNLSKKATCEFET